MAGELQPFPVLKLGQFTTETETRENRPGIVSSCVYYIFISNKKPVNIWNDCKAQK